jgi:hypothetical protein
MAGLESYAPRTDIPQAEKNDDWCKRYLSYAETILRNYNATRTRMTRLMNVYNGVKDPSSITWLTQRYGALDKAPYITYRVSRVKIDLLHGEWLRRPLVSTVTTVNSQAISDKMAQYDLIRGAMIARKELEDIKNIAGVDVMEGMNIPKDESEFEKMNFKEKCEDVMQIITNQQVKKLDAKQKIGEEFKYCELTSYAGMKVELDDKGRVQLWPLDPRDCIFEAIQGDDYADRSPIKGCRIAMPVHMILMRYDLTKDQRYTLENARTNWREYIGQGGISRGYMSYINGELLCDVVHIEWDSVTPLYQKVVPKTANQRLVDPDGETLTFDLDAKKYEGNKDFYDKQAVKEGYTIVTKFIEEKYEATRIGGIIDVNMRKVQGKKRSIDNPSEILSATYIFYVHGRINGTTVSLQQIMENYCNLYDIVRFMMNRELAKVKGKVLTIDRAAIGTKDKIIDQLYRMVNDQVLEYDSSAVGNLSGRQLDPSVLFKELDLGLSDSFQYLMAFKEDIRREIDAITGINDSRQGNTAASSTATAQQSDIGNSRTITEALFYGFSGFTKRVIKAIVDKSAISYAFYRTEEGEQILGAERYAFLISSMTDLAYRDYGVEIEDGSLYAELSEKIEKLMEVSLNAKELRTMDAMNVMLAETLAQKREFLVQGWAQVQAIAQQTQQSEMQAQAQMQQQALATQVQIAQEDREDKQKNDADLVILQGQVQMEVDNNKGKNALFQQNLKNVHDINMNEPTLE